MFGLRDPIVDAAGLANRIRILEPLDFSPQAVQILQSAGEVDLRGCSRDELPAVFAEYDVVWLRLARRIEGALLGAHPRCRYLATPVTGLDHVDLAACAARGIRVISLRGEVGVLGEVRPRPSCPLSHIEPQWLCCGTSCWRRRGQVTRVSQWNLRIAFGAEIPTAGRPASVGMGRLGTLVAGAGLRGLWHDRAGLRSGATRFSARRESWSRTATLDELLARSDLVVRLVSYDASTRGLLGLLDSCSM